MPDVIYHPIADTEGVTLQNVTLPADGVNPLDYTDILKFSHASNCVARNLIIHGGREDCVDMNRMCRDITVEDSILHPGGSFGFTIKGGSERIILKNLVFAKHAKEADIDLGNWSDQSIEKTKGVVLVNVTSSDGKPVRVRVLWADKPTVIGGNVKLIVIPKIFVKIYRFLRSRKLVP